MLIRIAVGAHRVRELFVPGVREKRQSFATESTEEHGK